MSISVDDIAPPSGDAWKTDVGGKVVGIITYAGKSQGQSYDRKRTEESLRIDLEVTGGNTAETGDSVTIYAVTNTDVDAGGYAKRNAKAIAAAVRQAGAKTLEVGGTLAMVRLDDVTTDFGEAKAWAAEYKPPPVAAQADAGVGVGAISGLID